MKGVISWNEPRGGRGGGGGGVGGGRGAKQACEQFPSTHSVLITLITPYLDHVTSPLPINRLTNQINRRNTILVRAPHELGGKIYENIKVSLGGWGAWVGVMVTGFSVVMKVLGCFVLFFRLFWFTL